MRRHGFVPVMILALFMTAWASRALMANAGGSGRVVAVCLWAENVQETAEFYSSLLELPGPGMIQGNGIRLRLEGAVLFILKGIPKAAESEDPFPLFALGVDALDKAESFLKSRDIRIPYGIEGSGTHRELQFYDPAGNLVELVQNQR